VLRKTCLFLALSGAAAAQEHLNTLWPPRGRQEDQFGAAVDCDGQRLVVGALRVNSPGVLFVYRREGANWIEEARLTNRTEPEFDQFDGFGWTAEIDGDHIAASARFYEGEVCVFDRQLDGSWLRTTIPAPDPVNEFAFGNEIQLDGDTLVATTYPRPAGLPDDALYVFQYIGGVWTETARLGGLHARYVSLDGDSLVVATQYPTGGLRFYERAGTDWVLTRTVPTPSAPLLARDGDVLVAMNAGATFYEHVGTDWVVSGTLAVTSGSIGLDGSRFYVQRQGSALRPLTVEVYERDDDGFWPLVNTIFPDALERPAYSSFGDDITFYHSDVIVADRSFHGTTVRSGAVVTYSHGERATLAASPLHVSILTGGSQELTLDAGVENAGRPYVLAGSLAGTSPGFSFGSHFIPLVREPLYYPLSRRFGVLDGSGRATLTVSVPPITPGFSHRTLHHAFVVLDHGIVHTSNVALAALNYRIIP
jgi:hypothetical protein